MNKKKKKKDQEGKGEAGLGVRHKSKNYRFLKCMWGSYTNGPPAWLIPQIQ
jgi:hypothetical protein